MTERWLEALPELLRVEHVQPRGVLHLGAHDGREVPTYLDLGFDRIVLVEPLPHRAEALRRLTPAIEVVEAAIAPTLGTAELYVTPHDEASSILRPIAWDVAAVVDVATVTLDALDLDGLNLVVVDVQGAEVAALSSGPLDGFDLVIVEATTEARYRGGATEADVDRFLGRAGFELAARYPHHVEPWVVDSAFRRA